MGDEIKILRPLLASLLTVERLRELLNYDPQTGVLTWRVRRGGIVAGSTAGRIAEDGYRRITIDHVDFYAQRLAWFWMTGQWPARGIDHRDCCRDNNRFANLREATASQNNKNKRLSVANTSGLKGASFHRGKGRWQAHIRHAGQDQHLGYFDTTAEAHEAYCVAAIKIDPEFARLA